MEGKPKIINLNNVMLYIERIKRIIVLKFLLTAINVLIFNLCWADSRTAGEKLNSISEEKPVDVKAYASFSEAIASPSTAQKTILVRDEQNCGTLSIPSDRTVRFIERGKLKIAQGHAVKFEGPVIADKVRIFVGGGKVSFGPGSVKEIYPEWFGASGDGMQDDRPYLQAMLNAMDFEKGAIIILTKSKRYRCSDYLMCYKNNVTLTGGGELWFDAAELTLSKNNPGVSRCGLNFGAFWVIGYGQDWQVQTDPNDVTTAVKRRANARISNIMLDGITISSIYHYTTAAWDEKRKAKPGGVLFWQVDGVIVRNCLMKNLNNESIVGIASRHVHINDNLFEDSGFSAIAGHMSDYEISNNRLNKVGRLFEGVGLRGKITGNICSMLSYSGISLHEAFWSSSIEAEIAGNIFNRDPQAEDRYAAIMVSSDSSDKDTQVLLKRITIQENIIIGNWKYGIFVRPPGKDGKIMINKNKLYLTGGAAFNGIGVAVSLADTQEKTDGITIIMNNNLYFSTGAYLTAISVPQSNVHNIMVVPKVRIENNMISSPSFSIEPSKNRPERAIYLANQETTTSAHRQCMINNYYNGKKMMEILCAPEKN